MDEKQPEIITLDYYESTFGINNEQAVLVEELAFINPLFNTINKLNDLNLHFIGFRYDGSNKLIPLVEYDDNFKEYIKNK